MEPLISVIVPIYRVEKYLRECVESILRQTYHNIEIILVDDGSPDDCGRICDEYAKADARIKVIHKKNGGLSEARNFGLDICRGELISFIDSDDYVSPLFLECLYRGLCDCEADIASLTYSVEFQDDSSDRPVLLREGDALGPAEGVEPMEALVRMSYQCIPNGAQFRLYRRDIFREIRFPVGYVFEDVATVYQTFLKANRIALIDGAVYAYRIRQGSIVRMKFSQQKMVVVEITRKMYEDLCHYGEELKKAAASRAFAQNYHVFLQIPFRDKSNLRSVWWEMKKYRGIVLRDSCSMMRKKNKIAAVVSYGGMTVSYWLGQGYLKIRQ